MKLPNARACVASRIPFVDNGSGQTAALIDFAPLAVNHAATGLTLPPDIQVEFEEVERAHHYTLRILEDFYDDRPTVEAALRAKGRLTAEAASAAEAEAAPKQS